MPYLFTIICIIYIILIEFNIAFLSWTPGVALSMCVFILAPAYAEHLLRIPSHLETYPLRSFVCSETVHRDGLVTAHKLLAVIQFCYLPALLKSEVDLC